MTGHASHVMTRSIWRDELRPALTRLSVIGPMLVLAGFGDGIHEFAWFLYYGGLSGLDYLDRGTAITIAAGLAWVLVTAASLLGWRLVASVLAWIALVGLIVGLRINGPLTLLPGAVVGWIMLAILSATALSLTSRADTTRVAAGEGKRLWILVVAVVAVVFARLLGHHYASFYWAAWAVLVVAVVFACHPRERSGIAALVVLSVPALSALGAQLVIRTSRDAIRPLLGTWPPTIGLFVALPLSAATVALLAHVRVAGQWRSVHREVRRCWSNSPSADAK